MDYRCMSGSFIPKDHKGTAGDFYTKEILKGILKDGCMDKQPRPVWSDGTPAHSLSYNHGICTYDLTQGESPLITLRPIAIKSSIGELLWIYQDESNDLDLLKNKYNVTWWDEWDIGNRTIGSVYGETVRVHLLVKKLLDGMKKDPDGRRHIICLWQESDFEKPHGLKPCAFMTAFNIRHEKNGIDYLDMCLIQRSSDFATAGCINQTQYLVFQHLIARHLDLVPGRFTWCYDNIQIYDRHIENAKIMIEREGIDCNPTIELNPNKRDFYDFTMDDIKVVGYPRKKILEKNPQLVFPVAK